MNNTRQVVKLDLSALNTESTAYPYQAFSIPALNGLLYNEYPSHSGGGPFGKLLSSAVKSVGSTVMAEGKNAAKDVAYDLMQKTRSFSPKKLFSSMRQPDRSSSLSSTSSERPTSPKQSFFPNRPTSPKQSSFPNRGLSSMRQPERAPSLSSTSSMRQPERQPERTSLSNRPSLPKQISSSLNLAVSSTSPDESPMQLNNPKVIELQNVLKEIGVKEDQLHKQKQQILKDLANAKSRR
jgi:hypothetical protein